MTDTHRIAVIPGDGIGTEAVPEGLRVLDAAETAFDFEHFDQSSADYYLKHGKMLPDNWFDEYVNLRTVRLMPRARSPLAGRKPGVDALRRIVS